MRRPCPVSYTHLPLWLELTVLLAASPFLEEIFFRGILFQRLKELMSVKAAAVVSALVFGCLLYTSKEKQEAVAANVDKA